MSNASTYPQMYAKSATTIANIMEAAECLFIERNFADVTMAHIAAEADVTKGALYHHFSSKEELYLRMMHDYLGEVQQLMEGAAAAEGSARERLRQLTLGFFAMSERKQRLMRLVRRDINIFQGRQREQLVRAYQAALPEQAERIIRDGIRDEEIVAADARLLAWEHVASVETLLAPYARSVLGEPRAMADFVIRLFFDGAARNNI